MIINWILKNYFERGSYPKTFSKVYKFASATFRVAYVRRSHFHHWTLTWKLRELYRTVKLLLEQFWVNFINLLLRKLRYRNLNQFSIVGQDPGIHGLVEWSWAPLRSDQVWVNFVIGCWELRHWPRLGHLRSWPSNKNLGINFLQSISRGWSLHLQLRINFLQCLTGRRRGSLHDRINVLQMSSG